MESIKRMLDTLPLDPVRRIVDAIPVRQAVVEIIIIALITYAVLRMLHGTRGAGVFRGLIFVFTIAAVLVSLLVA
jgi:hypothetical protein